MKTTSEIVMLDILLCLIILVGLISLAFIMICINQSGALIVLVPLILFFLFFVGPIDSGRLGLVNDFSEKYNCEYVETLSEYLFYGVECKMNFKSLMNFYNNNDCSNLEECKFLGWEYKEMN